MDMLNHHKPPPTWTVWPWESPCCFEESSRPGEGMVKLRCTRGWSTQYLPSSMVWDQNATCRTTPGPPWDICPGKKHVTHGYAQMPYPFELQYLFATANRHSKNRQIVYGANTKCFKYVWILAQDPISGVNHFEPYTAMPSWPPQLKKTAPTCHSRAPQWIGDGLRPGSEGHEGQNMLWQPWKDGIV